MKYGRGTIDVAGIAAALSRPGIDPRSWVSMGIVEPESTEAKSVQFEETVGPLVSVRLVPGGTVVNCRVSTWMAGNGEAAWYPFVGQDEVVVLIPGGNEREGCVIIGRCNNGIDEWPKVVGGQDTNTNGFGFQRMRVPFIVETASRYMIRSASTNAFMLLDEAGVWTIAGPSAPGGPAAFFHLGPDFIGLQDANADLVFQLGKDAGKFQCTLKTGEAVLSMGEASTGSGLKIPGTFYVTTSGIPSVEHAISTEAAANILSTFAAVLGPLFVPPIAAPAMLGLLAGAITAAATAPLAPPLVAAINAGVGLKVGGPGLPGIGCPGFQIG